jgi:hypothetical protein
MDKQGAPGNRLTWRRFLVAGLVALVVVIAIAQWRTAFDGLPCYRVGALFTTRTEYTPDYSDSKFRTIQPGMTEQEVKAILGAPFFEYQAFQEALPNKKGGETHFGHCWRYSRGGMPFLLRSVCFDVKAHVNRLEHVYYTGQEPIS